jgi:hypothetical protein
VERDKPKKSESVGQTLPQLPWKQKRGIEENIGNSTTSHGMIFLQGFIKFD